jgi:hypothetical protein
MWLQKIQSESAFVFEGIPQYHPGQKPAVDWFVSIRLFSISNPQSETGSSF